MDVTPRSTSGMDRPMGWEEDPIALERPGKLRPAFALAASGIAAVMIVAVIMLTGASDVRGTSDPTRLDCPSGYSAIGLGMPSRSYGSPRDAAVAYAMGPDGMGFSLDTPIIDVTDAFPASDGIRVFAVREGGRTVAIITATREGMGGWAVARTHAC